MHCLDVVTRRAQISSNLLTLLAHAGSHRAFKRPAADVVDLFLHGARERDDADGYAEQVVAG